jgi:hypothetical protein
MEYQTIETLIKGIKIYKLKMENIPEYCSFSSAHPGAMRGKVYLYRIERRFNNRAGQLTR